MSVWFCTREDVKTATDLVGSAVSDWQVDDAIEAGARSVEELTHRFFRPVVATRYIDWPTEQRGRSWRVWLDGNELISLTELTSGGVVIPPNGYILQPSSGDAPPFTSIEIDRSSAYAFSVGATSQRSLGLEGLFGFRNDEDQVGTLTADLAGTDAAIASISWSTARIGVGDVLRIGSERMTVVGRGFNDTTQNLGADLASSVAANTVAVATGSAFGAGTVIMVGSERMLVTGVAGNNLTVKRGWDGSVLAAHSTGADIYALSATDVDRAQLGTTIAAHVSGSVIYRHKVPGLVHQLNKAEAINTLQQESGAYGRTEGAQTSERDAAGAGLAGLRARVWKAYGRKGRTAAI
jgi:hypothetical protein